MNTNDGPAPARRSGVALWRQVADQLRAGIDRGEFGPGQKLPAEFEIARLHGVNRHTVRAAIASLAAEGLVLTRQGHGTVVAAPGRLSYPIRLRTRLSSGLADQVDAISSRLIASMLEPATASVADMLALSRDAEVVRVETVSEAAGRPISVATHWLAADRFENFAGLFQETGSITATLRRFGIEDYVRRQTRVLAGAADPADLEHLGLPQGSIVLVAIGLNVGLDDVPLHLTRTRFPADRIELRIEHEAR